MDQQSFIYNFLLAPQFRKWRYFALFLFFTIVSIDQALVGYIDIMPLIGNKVYLIVVGTILVYVITMYLVLKIILKDLLSGKYLRFVFGVILCASLFTAIPNIVYAIYLDNYVFFSESVLIDNLSAFAVFILCIAGVIIPVFLRNWIASDQHFLPVLFVIAPCLVRS